MSSTCQSAAPVVTISGRLSSLMRGGAWALGIRLVGAGGMFLSQFLLARYLGVTSFGEYALAMAWMQSLAVVGKLGLDNTSLRFVSEYHTKGERAKLRGFLHDTGRASLVVSLLVSVGMLAAVALLRSQMSGGLAWCLIIAAAAIPLLSVRQTTEACLRGVGRLSDSQISVAVWPVLMLSLILIARQFPGGLTSSVAMSLQVAAFAAVSLMVYHFRSRSALNELGDGELARDRQAWFATASVFLSAELLILLKSRCSVAIAGAMLGRDAAGLYAAMERISEATLLCSQSLSLVIAPQFATLHAQGKFAEMRKIVRYGQILALASTLPIALAIALVGDRLLALMGEGYLQGWGVLMLLLVSASVAAFTGPGGYVLQMTGGERTVLAVTALCAVANVGLSLLLMPSMGVLGLGVAQVVTSALWMSGLRIGLHRHPVWQRVLEATRSPKS